MQFVISIYAHQLKENNTVIVYHAPAIVEAESSDEAIGKAFRIAHAHLPDVLGFVGHHVRVQDAKYIATPETTKPIKEQ